MQNTSMFSDIQNHWARECISQMAKRNLISGYPDNTFRPNAAVKRAEFAAILGKAFPNAPPVRAAVNFVDVPKTYWAYNAIQAAYRTGFLSGYSNSIFKPTEFILRVQTLVALVAGLKYRADPNPNQTLKKYFDDAADIPNYATGAIATATKRYLVVNYPNIRRLKPNQNATRGEVAALICQVLNIPGVPLQYIAGIDFIEIPLQFDDADSFAGGLARVKIAGKWGYIDKTGKFVIQPQFDEANSFTDGLALVRQYKR